MGALLMPTTEITTSRWKIAVFLGGSLAFVAIAFWLLQHPTQNAWKLKLGFVFFGLCAALFVGLLINPQRLVLDHEGFTILGGFVRSPKKIQWRDIDGFFVYRLPRGGKMIGFNYKAGASPRPRLARFNRAFGAEGALPKGWPQSPEALAAQLNAYRAQALGGGAPRRRSEGP